WSSWRSVPVLQLLRRPSRPCARARQRADSFSPRIESLMQAEKFRKGRHLTCLQRYRHNPDCSQSRNQEDAMETAAGNALTGRVTPDTRKQFVKTHRTLKHAIDARLAVCYDCE